jgi:hypothetical protein
LRLATMFDPMNPAPPVTKNILPLAGDRTLRQPLPQSAAGRNHMPFRSAKRAQQGKNRDWTGRRYAG